MEFRWVAVIALWTLLSGPAFDLPTGKPRAMSENSAVANTSAQNTSPSHDSESSER